VLIAAAQQAAADGGGVDWKFVGGLITALLAIYTLWLNGQRAERTRRRELYAGAWAAVQAYKEFPFAIRRRSDDEPAAERVRISEELREVQKDLVYHEALVGRERSGRVATEYRNLVTRTREIAGGLIHEGWKTPPITADDQMNLGDVFEQLEPIKEFEDAYLEAMQDDLAWWRDFRPRGR
jgi:hypothetical protein